MAPVGRDRERDLRGARRSAGGGGRDSTKVVGALRARAIAETSDRFPRTGEASPPRGVDKAREASGAS
jgi:hypothetical protein